jgi:hypothetical protein
MSLEDKNKFFINKLNYVCEVDTDDLINFIDEDTEHRIIFFYESSSGNIKDYRITSVEKVKNNEDLLKLTKTNLLYFCLDNSDYEKMRRK